MAASKGAAELLRNAVVVNAAGGRHTATLLFLHGLGDTGSAGGRVARVARGFARGCVVVCIACSRGCEGLARCTRMNSDPYTCRHGWAQILAEIRPPSLKIICPNA